MSSNISMKRYALRSRCDISGRINFRGSWAGDAFRMPLPKNECTRLYGIILIKSHDVVNAKKLYNRGPSWWERTLGLPHYTYKIEMFTHQIREMQCALWLDDPVMKDSTRRLTARIILVQRHKSINGTLKIKCSYSALTTSKTPSTRYHRVAHEPRRGQLNWRSNPRRGTLRRGCTARNWWKIT